MNRQRLVTLRQLLPVISISQYTFISLQLGPAAAELRKLPKGVVVHDFTSRLHDWADTAVAHLAGALGKPIWLLNRLDSCWRWTLDRSDSPWYPTMRIHRQQTPGV